MINLLPPDIKNGYRYARRNVNLRRWVVICLLAFVGLGGLTTYGLLTLQQSTAHSQKHISENEAMFKSANYTSVQKQVQDISSSFKLVVQVLGKEILFSQLIQQIGKTIPDNANLTGLSISQVQGGIDITAVAANYKTATQVQVNLADPSNKIFSKADIENISCGGSNNEDAAYPCTVTIRALFGPNNPYLLINDKATKKAVKP